MSIKTKLDVLIDWYERYNPDAGKQIHCHATPSTVRRFARKEQRGGPLMYRGRVIVPLRKSRKTAEQVPF